MNIGMEKTIFENLLKRNSKSPLNHQLRIKLPFPLRFYYIGNLNSLNKFHGQNPGSGKLPVYLWETHGFVIPEIIAEPFIVLSFFKKIEFITYGTRKLIHHKFWLVNPTSRRMFFPKLGYLIKHFNIQSNNIFNG